MLLENVIIHDSQQGYCVANLLLDHGYIQSIQILDTDPDSFSSAEFYATPGFVNSHLHPNQLLDRRMLDELSITELLHQMHGNYKKSDDERYLQSLFVLMEAVKAGATSIYAVANNPYPVIRAFKALGIKGAVSCFYNDQWEGYGDPPTMSTLSVIEEHFAIAHSQKTELMDIHIGSSSIESASNDLLLLINQLALRHQSKVNIHVSEGIASVQSCLRSRRMTPIRLLSQLKVLASHWNLVHAVTIDDEEIKLIANSGARIIHCPVTNAKTGVGIAPIKKLLEQQVMIGLGSDACSNNNTNNILNEAYFASLLQTAFCLDAQAISVDLLMKWLTINGHQIIGSQQRGVIEVGEPADLLLWSLQENSFVPLAYGKFDSALIYNAPDLKPHTVLINGKKIVENYQFTLVAEEEMRETVNRCGHKAYLCMQRSSVATQRAKEPVVI